MPRKKMKHASKVKSMKTKRQIKMSNTVLAESIEKDFKHVPIKLAALYAKELQTVKAQMKKLMDAVTKTEKQKASANSKCTSLAAKTTPTAKKQLKKEKKLLTALNATASKLSAEFEKVKKHCNMLMQKQVKYTELGKELAKLEKTLDAKAKAAVEKLQPKSSAKPRKKTAKKVVKQLDKTETTAVKHVENNSVKSQELPTTSDIEMTTEEFN